MTSGPGKPRRWEFEERDSHIKDLLLTPDGDNPQRAKDAREQGMFLLDEAFRWPVAGYLRYLASRSEHNSLWEMLTPAVLKRVWQDTMVSVWRDVTAGKLKREGSLFSYLLTIAVRRAYDLCRRKKQPRVIIDPDFDPAQIEDRAANHYPSEFYEKFEEFLDTLDSSSKLVFKTDFELIKHKIDELDDQQARKLAANDDVAAESPATDEKVSRRVTAEDLYDTLRRNHPEHGWTLAGVRRARSRVRSKLRGFLKAYDR